MKTEEKLLLAKAEDAVKLSNIKNIPKFLGFLSESEQSCIARSVFCENAVFFGGFDDAERKMYGVLPDYIDDKLSAFPITVLKIEYREKDTLSHRDVLGAFMSAGIKRSLVGDILFYGGSALAFINSDIADYLINQITKIKNIGVKIKVVENFSPELTLPVFAKKEIVFTVSSARLDAVLNGLTGCKRSRAEELITDGLVFVNSFEALKSTAKIKVGDKISVRGKGKFVIKSMGNYSKKGREIITADKYI